MSHDVRGTRRVMGWAALAGGVLGDKGSIALALNSLCIGGGIIGLRFGWKFWREQ